MSGFLFVAGAKADMPKGGQYIGSKQLTAA